MPKQEPDQGGNAISDLRPGGPDSAEGMATKSTRITKTAANEANSGVDSQGVVGPDLGTGRNHAKLISVEVNIQLDKDMRKLGITLISLVSFAVLAVGCAVKTPLSADPNTAVAQMKNLVPQGTSVAAAEVIMTKEGFHCTRLAPPRPGKNLLLCSIDDGRQPVKRRWLVSLEVKEERVVGYAVTTDLVGP